MCFNVGVIIGPVLSGFLADPVQTLPGLFGPGSSLGGSDGVQWLRKFPYALPNLFFATVLSISALAIVLGLDETHPHLRNRPDYGRRLGKLMMRAVLPVQYTANFYSEYQEVPSSSTTELLVSEVQESPGLQPESKPQPPFRSIFTKNVCLTMLQHFLQSLHVSAFNTIFFSLLPAPRANNLDFHLPFRFSGGLGLSSQKVGFANTTIGMIGIPLQLVVYPMLIGRVGVKRSYRTFLPLSIAAYCLLPYLVVLPDNVVLIWTCLSAILVLHLLSRTFVNPATVMLVDDSAPSPNLLGTVHGVATSISSFARIMGPTTGGLLLGWGLAHNIVGLPLWVLTIVAVVNWIVLFWIKDVTMSHH